MATYFKFDFRCEGYERLPCPIILNNATLGRWLVVEVLEGYVRISGQMPSGSRGNSLKSQTHTFAWLLLKAMAVSTGFESTAQYNHA